MKKETVEAKLNALFGLTKKAEEVKTRSTGKVVGVTEEEIQEFREMQGLIYFLQAPALFEHKICPRCGEHFYVSRKYVSHCSYTCIKIDLQNRGFDWRKGNDLEAIAQDPQVYNGNEPIWIRQESLKKLKEMVSKLPDDWPPTVEKPSYESLFSQNQDTTTQSGKKNSTSSPSVSTMTNSGTATKSTKSKKPKRRIISVN